MHKPVNSITAVPAGIWWRLGIGFVIAGQAMVFSLGMNITPLEAFSFEYWVLHGLLMGSALVVIVLLGPRLFKETGRAIVRGEVTVEAMFCLSALGALVASAISTIRGEGPVFYEVVAIVLSIYTLGKTVALQAKDKVWAEVRKLREVAGKAHVLDAQGTVSLCELKEVGVGARVVVEPGQMITVDGIIFEGEAYIEQAAMTGEPAPVRYKKGDVVLAGTYSLDGRLVVEVQKVLGERLLDAVLSIVEGVSIKPSRLQEQADRFMQGFVPLVLCVSIATFIVWYVYADWTVALFNSMAVLLVACPCALGLATPIAVWSALWNLSSHGLVIKTGVFLDALGHSTLWVFDKTGTLSEAALRLGHWAYEPEWKEQEGLLQALVCGIEAGLTHPIARTFRGLLGDFKVRVLTRNWIAGGGVEGEVILNEVIWKVRVGNLMWLGQGSEAPGKWIGVEINGRYAGKVALEEGLRSDAVESLNALADAGLRLAILTGDTAPLWENIGNVEVYSAQSPLDKVNWVKKWQAEGERVVFVGDGLNDAAAMAEAATAVAMNGAVALTAGTASAVLMGEVLQPLVLALKVARRVRASVRSNIIIALSYNIVGVCLAAGGYLHPVVAALLMGFSSGVVTYRALKAACVV